MRSSIAVRALALASLLSCAAVVAACSSPGNSAGPAATVTVTTTPASSPSTSAPDSPAPVTSTAAPAGPPPCATRDLSVTLGLSQGAAGSAYQVIDFKNVSQRSCTLYGYPGVSLAGGSPVKQIGSAAKEDPATPRRLVTLTSGGVASALLRTLNVATLSAAKCGPEHAAYLQIYPPNQTTPVYVAYSATACSKPIDYLTIDTVRKGSGG